ncbi:MAG: TfoX/Sxy family protein [Armatimonadota bacterium]|nr:TfoX/Sxy family protein [Armatimonadota bacterium]
MREPFLDEMQDRLSQAAEARALDGDLTFMPMFGGVCAYIGSRVFASLSDIGLALKLPAEAQAELLAEDGAKRLQYEPDAPPSKQYIVVPPPMQADPTALAGWLARSVGYVLALPAPKPRTSKQKRKVDGVG